METKQALSMLQERIGKRKPQDQQNEQLVIGFSDTTLFD